MDTDGENLKQLTQLGSYSDSPKWSPKGNNIAFVSGSGVTDNATFEIYSVDVRDNKIRQLTNNKYYDSNPIWSPDGSKIAFQSSTGDNVDLYMLNFYEK